MEQPVARTQRVLRDSMKGLSERLLAVCDADELDADLQRQLALVMEIFNGFGEVPLSGKRATRKKGPRRSLRDASVLILGRDWEAQALPGAHVRAGAARDRRRDVWVTKAIKGNLMKKVYTIFIKKEERYDRSRGHR